MVNWHTIIVAASIVVIVGTFGYSLLGVFAANNLQFRWHQIESFDLLTMMIGGNLSVCNNSDYPATFRSYTLDLAYDGNPLGKFTTDGAAIAPHTSAMIDGKFSTDDKRVANILLLSLDTAMSGSGQAARINPENMEVSATVETTIIGLVPFPITQQYSGPEFVDMMNQKTNCDE